MVARCGGREQNEQEVEKDPLHRFRGSVVCSPIRSLEVLEKCFNQQGIPKNVMIGTKNIKIGPLGPELAHTKVTVGLHKRIGSN